MSLPLFSRLRSLVAYPLVLVLAVEADCDGTAEPLFPADPAARRRFVPAMVRFHCQFLQLLLVGNWFTGSLGDCATLAERQQLQCSLGKSTLPGGSR